MEPQDVSGDIETPLHEVVEGPSVFDWEVPVDVDKMTDAELLADAGIEPIVSTSDAAEYFDRTTQWIYWGLKPDPGTGEVRFVWPNGDPIVPDRVRERRRFTLPILRAILAANYRRGNFTDDELKIITRRIKYTELGVEWREKEGWVHASLGRNRHRWVKPEEAYLDDHGNWRIKKNPTK